MKKTSAPIGWDGKKIRDMLEESERLFLESGRYYGLKRLHLKESDPIRFEKIFSRARAGLVNARETAMNISASPIVKEIGELCFALYSPEGDAVTLSTGIMAHVHTMSDAIKFMIRANYEENPGIRPRDIFCNNDPLIGDVHNCDIQTIVPIFWRRELVGWAAGVTHELDIGASFPGPDPVGPVSRYDGGLVISAEKIGEGDELYVYYLNRCKWAVRTPNYWTLDEKARIAGCHMIRSAVEKLIQQEGIDTYKLFVREVIEDGRLAFKNRIQEMTIPGVYNAATFIDLQFADEKALPTFASKDWLMHCPMKITIDADGGFDLSMAGASEWVWNQVNASPTAMQGGLWVLITQTLIPNDKVNDGAYLATKQFFPKGSWTNPDTVIAGTDHAWFALTPAFTSLLRSLSRAYQARGYLEEVVAAYGNTYNSLNGGGKNALGAMTAFTNFEIACVGLGAGYVKDGLDYASAMFNPEGDMGDVESWEMVEPLIYLGRKIKPNSAGPGKFRGGSGFESLRMVWKATDLLLQFIGDGKVLVSSGLFGGYPSAGGYRHAIHNSNMKRLIDEQQPYPTCEGSPDESEITNVVKGAVMRDKKATTLPEPYEDYDLYLNYLRGGPGCGDPLEREPEQVREDLEQEFISAKYAESVYGVVAERARGREWAVDHEATKKKRESIRRVRSDRARPVLEWISEERERVLNKKFIKVVLDMYRSSCLLSEEWASEYRDFWKLPKDFTFREDG